MTSASLPPAAPPLIRSRAIRVGLYAASALFAFIWGFWLVSVPEAVLLLHVDAARARSPWAVEVKGFKKGLFYSIHADEVSVALPGGAGRIAARDLRVGLDLGRLLLLRPGVKVSGELGRGALSASAHRDGPGVRASLALTGASLAGIHLPEGITGDGTVELEATLDPDGRGVARIAVRDLAVERFTTLGFAVPAELFSAGRAQLVHEGGVLTIESCVLEGQEAFARLSGTVRGTLVNLSLELTTSERVERENSAVIFLKQYERSPHSYVVPLRFDAARFR